MRRLIVRYSPDVLVDTAVEAPLLDSPDMPQVQPTRERAMKRLAAQEDTAVIWKCRAAAWRNPDRSIGVLVVQDGCFSAHRVEGWIHPDLTESPGGVVFEMIVVLWNVLAARAEKRGALVIRK